MPFVYHSFVSDKVDGADSTLVKPSNWNAKLETSNFNGTGPSGTDLFVRDIGSSASYQNITYYVRPDGSNSNTGLANTSTGAFATWAWATQYAQSYPDTLSGQITIISGSSTAVYTNDQIYIYTTPVGTSYLVLDGNGCTIASGAANTVEIGGAPSGSIQIQNITLTATSATAIHWTAPSNTIIGPGMVFGAVNGAHMYVGGSGVNVYCSGTYTINGGGTWHVLCYNTAGGVINLSAASTITLNSTPNFSGAFVDARYANVVIAGGLAFIGGATGSRYNVTSNAVIDTAGGGATYFPGSIAGASASGGQYL